MTRLELMELAEECSDVLSAMEDDLLENIAEYLSEGRTDIPTSQWKIQQLASLGKLDKANIRTIAEYSGIAADMEEIAMTRAALSAVKEMDEGFGKLVTDGIIDGTSVPMEETALQAAAMYSKQAKDRLNKVNTVMRYFARTTAANAINTAAELMNKQQHLDTLNKAAGKVIMGAESRQTAVRQCIKEMSAKGIPAFVDAAGRQWSPEAYINMDVRTTCSNTAHEVQFTRMNDYDIDLLEVSSHAGARPKCSLDQGKIFSKSDKNKKYPAWSTSSYGEPDGILGINCGHHIYPYIEGVSIQTYFPYDKEENDKLYKQKQEQRRLERDVRSAKREASMLSAAGDKEGAKAAKDVVKQKTAKYNEYCEKTGLPRKPDRLTVQGYRTKADNEKKSLPTLDNSGGNGIINIRSELPMNALTRKVKPDNYVNPMPKKQFQRICKSFKSQGGIIQMSDATDEYLKSKNAEAITYDSKTILLKQNPSRASVYEELIHTYQYKTGENDGSYESRLKCEISAQKKLIKYSKEYKLTKVEIIQTQRALEAYENELKEYYKNGGA